MRRNPLLLGRLSLTLLGLTMLLLLTTLLLLRIRLRAIVLVQHAGGQMSEWFNWNRRVDHPSLDFLKGLQFQRRVNTGAIRALFARSLPRVDLHRAPPPLLLALYKPREA